MIITDMPHVTTKNQIVNALGYTPADQEDVLLKGEVDGRNLLPFSKKYTFANATIERDNTINGIIIKNILTDKSGGRRYARINNISGLLKGSYYTISGEIYAEQNIDAAFDLSDGDLSDIIHVTNSPQKFVVTVKNGISGNFVDISFETVPDSLEVYIKDFKIEPGINPNPHWTPAPEDVVVRSELEQAVTGENLLLNSDVEQNSTSDLIASWDMASTDVINQEYTFTVCITPSSGMTDILLHRNNLSGLIDSYIPLKGTGKQIISHTFVNTESSISRLIHPGIGRIPKEDTGKAVVHWAKLEKGINQHPFWTPSPYDYQKDILARLAIIEEKLAISAASDESHNDMQTVTADSDRMDGSEQKGYNE